MELRVLKEHDNNFFFTASHSDVEFKTISLKRSTHKVGYSNIIQLNKEPNIISKEKYQDLVSLCIGD